MTRRTRESSVISKNDAKENIDPITDKDDGLSEKFSKISDLKVSTTSDHFDELKIDKCEEYFDNSSRKSEKKKFLKAREDLDFSSLNFFSKQEFHVPDSLKERMKLLDEHNQGLFSQWMLTLSCGFNILLFGVGSKYQLLENFKTYSLDNGNKVLVINGFDPNLRPKQLASFFSSFSGIPHTYESSSKSIQFNFEERKNPKDSKFDSIILIHNIDSCFSDYGRLLALINNIIIISKSMGIRVIASIDKINSSLLWDSIHLPHYCWVSYNVTTFKTYKVECSVKNPIMSNQLADDAISSISSVISSLSANSQEIFNILARSYLDLDSNSLKLNKHIGFSQFYDFLRSKFLISNESSLVAILNELCDHKIVKPPKKGGNWHKIVMAYPPETIQSYLDTLENN